MADDLVVPSFQFTEIEMIEKPQRLSNAKLRKLIRNKHTPNWERKWAYQVLRWRKMNSRGR
jgi:hypothetical protein